MFFTELWYNCVSITKKVSGGKKKKNKMTVVNVGSNTHENFQRTLLSSAAASSCVSVVARSVFVLQL